MPNPSYEIKHCTKIETLNTKHTTYTVPYSFISQKESICRFLRNLQDDR